MQRFDLRDDLFDGTFINRMSERRGIGAEAAPVTAAAYRFDGIDRNLAFFVEKLTPREVVP